MYDNPQNAVVVDKVPEFHPTNLEDEDLHQDTIILSNSLYNSTLNSTDSFAGQLGQEYILLLINLLLLKYFHGFLVRRIWVSFNFTKLLKDNEFDQAEILSCNCPFCHQQPLSFNIDTTSNRSHQHLCI